MTFEQFLGFAVFAYVASATPGPNNVIMTATGASVGIRRGLPTMFGIICGFGLMCFLIALGVGSVSAAIDRFMIVVRVAGLAVLLWLAWKIATAPVGAGTEGDSSVEPPRVAGFVAAALFQWVNPKAWMAVAGAVSAYLHSEAGAFEQALLFGVVFFVAGALGTFPWLALGYAIRRFLRKPMWARSFNIAMAVLLVVSVLPTMLQAF